MLTLKRIWTERWLPLFGIDLRSLALFRVLLALVLFVDTLRRLSDVRAFYTDAGVMPRAWAALDVAPWRWSLHMANGESWFQVILILALAAAAFALMLGWRTRLATIVCWVLTLSIANRNTMILIGGDYLLCCLLFWSLFLPLGARWSVDAALSTQPPPKDNLHLSWASAALLLQVLSVYFFSALLKSGPDWYPNFTAVYYALSLDSYLYPPGALLLKSPELMKALSAFVWSLELVGPLLVLLPLFNRVTRTAVLLLLVLMHLGFIFTLAIGHFPYVSIASVTILLGGWFWDWRARAHERRLPGGNALRIYYDRDCGFCLKSVLLFREFFALPKAQIAPAQDNGRAGKLMQANNSWVVIDHDDKAYLKWPAFVQLLRRSPLFGGLGRLLSGESLVARGNRAYDFVARHRARFGAVTAVLLPQRAEKFELGRNTLRVVGVLMAATLVWNLTTVRVFPMKVQNGLRPLFNVLRIDQIWDMFAPYPLKDDGWYVIPGTLADGTELDVLKPEHRPASFDKPRWIALDWKNFRWHIYQLRLWEKRYSGYRLYWGRYLCRDWNEGLKPDSPQRLMDFKIVYMLENTKPDFGPTTIEQQVMWRHECFGAASNAAPPG